MKFVDKEREFDYVYAIDEIHDFHLLQDIRIRGL